MKYGMISNIDGQTIEKTIDLILKEFHNDEFICTTEVGIFDGQTSRGIHEYIESKNRGNWHTAIDNNKDKQVTIPFPQCTFIIGNSNEVYNQLKDESQHFIFIDSCHCFAHVVSDFFCYAPKVKIGGYLLFHDTGNHIKQFKDFQHGDKENTDAYISVRKALIKVGLLFDEINGLDPTLQYDGILNNWYRIFDKADLNDDAGGICVFKKIYS